MGTIFYEIFEWGGDYAPRAPSHFRLCACTPISVLCKFVFMTVDNKKYSTSLTLP